MCKMGILYYLSGQNPHFSKPGTSFEKQQVVRTVVFNSCEGSKPCKYVAKRDLGAIPTQTSSDFNISRSILACLEVVG